jgi:hypothetical protein
MVRPKDAERALRALEAAGFLTERPPEEWLYKAWDGDVLADLIFKPSGGTVDGDMFERAEELEVQAVRMQVMSLEHVMVAKLLSLREHEVDYESVLEITRALREQIDWDDVRRRTQESPYARAFFFLAEELEILDPAESLPEERQKRVEDRAVRRHLRRGPLNLERRAELEVVHRYLRAEDRSAGDLVDDGPRALQGVCCHRRRAPAVDEAHRGDQPGGLHLLLKRLDLLLKNLDLSGQLRVRRSRGLRLRRENQCDRPDHCNGNKASHLSSPSLWIEKRSFLKLAPDATCV